MRDRFVTVTKSFSATGVSDSLFVRRGDSISYTADLSSDFSGSLILQRTKNGGITYDAIRTITADVAATMIAESEGNYRFKAVIIAGTADTVLTEVNEAVQEFFNKGGETVFETTEMGINVLGNLNTNQASDVASSTSVDLEAIGGNIVNITGTTTISSIVLGPGRFRLVRFAGSLTLTNSSSLNMGGTDVVTHADDYIIFAGFSDGTVGAISSSTGGLISGKYISSDRLASVGATSGQVTLPANFTPTLQSFFNGLSATTTTLVAGVPTYKTAQTSLGVDITTSFDASGNFVLSGIPSSFPIGIIYRGKQTFANFDSTSSDILWSEVEFGLTLTPNQYGVLVSGAGMVGSVIAPVASTTAVLKGGGLSANPTWQEPSAPNLAPNNYVGDGSTVNFTLSNAPPNENTTLVFIQGVYQQKTTYSVSGTTLTFSTAPALNDTVEVMVFY